MPAGPLTVVGNGLAGALLACYLGQRGRRVRLFERRGDPRQGGAERGRSINLALSTRGLHALSEVGLVESVLAQAVPMRGRLIHAIHGALAFQPYGKDESQVLYSVSRGELNRQLIEAAGRYSCVEMAFEHRCTGLDLSTNTLHFAVGPGGESREVAGGVIVGADGAYSAVRAALQRRERFDYSQDYLSHGYKELTIAPGAGGTFRLEQHALHIWPRGGFMMIALPNADGSFTCTLFWPYEGPNSFSSLHTEDAIRSFFQAQFPDAVPLLPDLVEQYRANPIGSLVTVRCAPWHLGGQVVLVGDAAHAVVPFLGQGMNAAFEDCATLVRCLEQHADTEAAFAAYHGARKEHLDALAEQCVANFYEMRDKVGSRLFRLRKGIDLFLHALMPRLYLPLYTMIEFTRIPYADAVRRARRQGWIAALAGGALLVGAAVLVWRWLA